MHLREARTS